MGRRSKTEAPRPLTVLEKVESAALQAIDERDDLKTGLESLKMEREASIRSYDQAIEATEEKLRKSTILADGLSQLFETEGIR